MCHTVSTFDTMQLLDLNDWLSVFVGAIDDARKYISKPEDIQLVAISASDHQHSENLFLLNNLGQLYWFAKFLEDAKAQSVGSRLVLCTGSEAETITACALLAGGYLIFFENASVEQITSSFHRTANRFQAFDAMSVGEGLTVHDGWRALYQAKANGWLHLHDEEVDIDSTIDVQEYQHYDNPLNGYLHVIIPSRLIAISAPSNLVCMSATSNGQWLDVDGQRFFGPEFYADILGADFGVEVLVRCDAGEHCDPWHIEENSDSDEETAAGARAAYDDSPFVDRGMAVEQLAISRGDGALSSGALLRDVDRFLTLARLAPGAIAIHGSDGPALGCGGELLVSSLLIKQHGFDARSALAWTRMAHPPVAPRSLAFSLAPKSAAEEAPAAPSTRRAARRMSAPAALPCPAAAAAVPADPASEPAAAAGGPGCAAAVEGAGGRAGASAPAAAGKPMAARPGYRWPLPHREHSASAPDVFDQLGLNPGPAPLGRTDE